MVGSSLLLDNAIKRLSKNFAGVKARQLLKSSVGMNHHVGRC
jgi:hypothetical protein